MFDIMFACLVSPDNSNRCANLVSGFGASVVVVGVVEQDSECPIRMLSIAKSIIHTNFGLKYRVQL